MIIVGTSGAAKEILTVISQFDDYEIVFFNDYEKNIPKFFSKNFKIINSISDLKSEFKINNSFVLEIGNPLKRRALTAELTKIGGHHTGLISPFSKIGKYGNTISDDVTILTDALISCCVKIGEGVLINKSCIISHDVSIGSFTVISPNTQLLGNVSVGKNCFIGAGAIINPSVSIGDNSVIGSGSVVLKDVPKNSKYAGNPARKIN